MSGLTAPTTVAVGTSVNFTISFQPTAAGTASGNVSISSNAGNSPLSIPLSGTGVASILTLSANPASLAFGNVTVGATATQNDQITNTGNATVDITTVSATGTGFSVTGGSNTVLAPNQSVTVTVSFNPQTAGSPSGSVAVSSNAPTINISLSGTGTTAPVQHSVSLAWDPSPSTDIVSYVLYRRTGTTGSFTKVGSTNNTATTFTDTTVQGNQTYFYQVTCVDSNNLESDVDGPVTATTPGP
jgi:fibronectin type 3 domain-containing protein